MKTLVFLRHGESDWDAQGRYQGQTDVPLSETGRAQAYEAARRWGHTEFDSVIVSPLTRTKDTGRIMLLDRQLEPILVNDIIETDGGAWEGLLFSEIAERWPDEHAAFRLPNLDSGPVGVETTRESGTRATYAVLDAHETANDLLVVAHGNTLRYATHNLTDHNDDEITTRPHLSNSSAHVLQSNSGELCSFTLTQTSV